jgi:hypothetical protein
MSILATQADAALKPHEGMARKLFKKVGWLQNKVPTSSLQHPSTVRVKPLRNEEAY